MTPKQGRRLLRELNRRNRRETLAGIYKYQSESDPPGVWFTIRADGVPVMTPGAADYLSGRVDDALPLF